MGNCLAEVQSKITMGIIDFIDDPTSTWDVVKMRLFRLHWRFWEWYPPSGMVRKHRCCIATVRVDDLPVRSQIVNSLLQLMVCGASLAGMPLAGCRGVDVAGRRRIRAHKIESSANV